MDREQAKAYKIKLDILTVHYLRNGLAEVEARENAFKLINQAIGHNGIEKYWDVFCHFADGGEVKTEKLFQAGTWFLNSNPHFLPKEVYKKAEKPFILGGITLPERPQTEPLEEGQHYFRCDEYGNAEIIKWRNDDYDLQFLKNLEVFLTHKGAEAFHKARLAMVKKALKGED